MLTGIVVAVPHVMPEWFVSGDAKEVGTMAQIPKDVKFLLFGMGPKWHAVCALILDVLGAACLVVGIVAAARGSDVGLAATHWLLAAIALFAWGLWSWLAAYLGAKEG